MTDTEVHSLLSAVCPAGETDACRLVETHISWLILTPTLVYKIKKPLKLSFLDFSTLALRKFYCLRELELNARLTENVYRRLASIHRCENGILFDVDSGPVIDYAVEMRRLDDTKLMSSMLAKRQVHTGHVHAVADVLAEFHARTQRVASSGQAGILADAFRDISENRTDIGAALGESSAAFIDAAVAWSDAFLARHGDLLERRAQRGLVRDCHGDLHANNIFLYEPPVIFDCIEFNDHYRHIDVLNELAFLFMDLEAYDEPLLAQTLLERYAAESPLADTQEDALLIPYFACYRANVRAKVTALRLRSAGDAATRKSLQATLARYLALMRRYIGRSGTALPDPNAA